MYNLEKLHKWIWIENTRDIKNHTSTQKCRQIEKNKDLTTLY